MLQAHALIKIRHDNMVVGCCWCTCVWVLLIWAHPDVHMHTYMCMYIYIMYIYYKIYIYIMYMKINPTYMAYMKSVNFGGHMHIHKLYTVILGPMMFGVCVCGCAAWQHCEWPTKIHNFTPSVLIMFAILVSVTFWSMACGICWFCFLLPRSVWLVDFLHVLVVTLTCT